MQILLKEIKLNDLTFFGCFFSRYIEIKIIEYLDNCKNEEFSFSLKCEDVALNTILTISERSRIYINVLTKDKMIANFELERNKIHTFYRYKNLHLEVLYEFSEYSSFELCAQHDIKKEGKIFTKKLGDYNTFELRSYGERIYNCDKNTLKTEWQEFESNDSLPNSNEWEAIKADNNVVFCVNHSYKLVFPPAKSKKEIEKSISLKSRAFRSLLDNHEGFKYFVFSKFTLYIRRHFFIQSSASYFLRIDKCFLRRNLHIKMKDEIGEDEGGIKDEFFNEIAHEIARDRRMQFIDGFLDVNPDIYNQKEPSSEKMSPIDAEPQAKISDDFYRDIYQEYESEKNSVNKSSTKSRMKPKRNHDSIYQIYEKDDFLVNQEEFENLNDQFRAGLKFSRIPDIRQGHAIKFWESIEKKNQKFINDTNQEFFTEENYGKNLLTDDEFYAFVGIYIALCLFNKEMIPIKFSYGFLENLFHLNYSIKHIQDVEVQRNMLYVLRTENLPEDVYYSFDESFKHDKNLMIKKCIYDSFYFSRKRAYDLIYYFFYSLMPKGFNTIYEASDLYFILDGRDVINLDFLLNSFVYSKCNERTKEIKYLRRILSTKNESYYRMFLKFVTGSENITMQNDQAFLFRIVIEQADIENQLFRASACAKILFIGKYQSKNKMEEIMDFSIMNTEGFHKV